MRWSSSSPPGITERADLAYDLAGADAGRTASEAAAMQTQEALLGMVFRGAQYRGGLDEHLSVG